MNPEANGEGRARGPGVSGGAAFRRSPPSPKGKLPACAPSLVVCDVDGVILRGYLLLTLARRKSLWAGLVSALDCLLYELRVLSLETLLRRVYRRVAGLGASEMKAAYDSLRIVPNAERAFSAMRAAGQEIWLLSSGVPQDIVADLVVRLGASGGAGIVAETRGGRLTGKASGGPATSRGKLAFVEGLHTERGIGWDETAVIADDRCNLDIIERAGLSVGFRSTYSVRRRAKFLVDAPDFAPVAEIVTAPEAAARQARSAAATPFREIRRKVIHGLAVLAVVAHPACPGVLDATLLVAALLYTAQEALRLNGAALPVLTYVTRQVVRPGEARRLALAPLTLAAGVLLSLSLFPANVAYASILIVAVADSVAALVGMNWGVARLPYNPSKTMEGTAASFAVGLSCALVYLPLWPAFAAAFFGSVLESLDLADWDNLLLPLVAGTAATAVLAQAAAG